MFFTCRCPTNRNKHTLYLKKQDFVSVSHCKWAHERVSRRHQQIHKETARPLPHRQQWAAGLSVSSSLWCSDGKWPVNVLTCCIFSTLWSECDFCPVCRQVQYRELKTDFSPSRRKKIWSVLHRHFKSPRLPTRRSCKTHCDCFIVDFKRGFYLCYLCKFAYYNKPMVW